MFDDNVMLGASCVTVTVSVLPLLVIVTVPVLGLPVSFSAALILNDPLRTFEMVSHGTLLMGLSHGVPDITNTVSLLLLVRNLMCYVIVLEG